LIGAGLLALVLAAIWWRDRRANARERERMRRTEASGLHLPASLHPVIDPAVCIGSRACVAACPEGDVLGVVDGAGRLIHGAACIGHGRCATECPVDAIHLVFGTSERGVDIPFLTSTFETSRAGVYVAGELGGMGLIRNAVRQGVGAARDAIACLEPSKNGSGRALDLLIVGAGPAGLGAGLAAVEAGKSYRVIEQDTVGGSVAHYPRHKVVMTEPVEVPLFGRVHRAEISKEELLELWSQVILESRLDIQTDCRLEEIEGEDGGFVAKTSAGTIRARKVVLAVGRRGTPRRLQVPGEESPQVTYSLTDPQQYAGNDVLVVGGGDSALEAAAALCDESDARCPQSR
jgi:Pyruvate/2-oxoacid:ferredoxin oxidoreductase delta subunit